MPHIAGYHEVSIFSSQNVKLLNNLEIIYDKHNGHLMKYLPIYAGKHHCFELAL